MNCNGEKREESADVQVKDNTNTTKEKDSGLGNSDELFVVPKYYLTHYMMVVHKLSSWATEEFDFFNTVFIGMQ